MGKYEDIINLPHHVSTMRHRMSMLERAAQFQSFRALTGYEDAVKETARLTDARAELTEEEKSALDAKLRLLAGPAGGEVSLTCFQPDGRKDGGAYFTVTSAVKKIDGFARGVVLADGRRIPVDDIVDVQFEASEAE